MNGPNEFTLLRFHVAVFPFYGRTTMKKRFIVAGSTGPMSTIAWLFNSKSGHGTLEEKKALMYGYIHMHTQ